MIKWLCNKIVQWGQDYDQDQTEEAYVGIASNINGRRKGTRAIPISQSDKPDIPRTF